MTWKAHLTDEFAQDGLRLLLWRDATEATIELITHASEATPGGYAFERVERSLSMAGRGFVLPRSALEAVAELLKPGPSSGEVKRLEEALEVERRRVDAILTQPRPRPPGIR